jgi:16S rRNA (uracil1498-N3)-methyltransferase
VSRVRPGGVVRLIDGEGSEALARVERAARAEAVATILERRTRHRSEGTALTLVQGLLKGKAMPELIRRAAELGVAEIVPVTSVRTVGRIPPGTEDERLERWRSVALAATKQSRGVFVTAIEAVQALPDILRLLPGFDLSLVAWEEEVGTGLADALSTVKSPRTMLVVVGPEGGLSGAEVRDLTEAGALAVGVGSRVLKADWAGAAIAAMIGSAIGGLLP